jgi:hypothetical protein
VAVVAPHGGAASASAARLESKLPGSRLLPMTPSEYLRRSGRPIPLILSVLGTDPAADRRFLERVRDRILWPSPPPDLYDAICGVLTSLPTRRRPTRRGAPDETAGLLLEGDVGADRARAALDSPVRQWVAEHPGRVRLAQRDLALLRNAGVRWSALFPVRLVAVSDPANASRGLFPAGTRIWRTPERAATTGRASRVPSRRSSRK